MALYCTWILHFRKCDIYHTLDSSSFFFFFWYHSNVKYQIHLAIASFIEPLWQISFSPATCWEQITLETRKNPNSFYLMASCAQAKHHSTLGNGVRGESAAWPAKRWSRGLAWERPTVSSPFGPGINHRVGCQERLPIFLQRSSPLLCMTMGE